MAPQIDVHWQGDVFDEGALGIIWAIRACRQELPSFERILLRRLVPFAHNDRDGRNRKGDRKGANMAHEVFVLFRREHEIFEA